MPKNLALPSPSVAITQALFIRPVVAGSVVSLKPQTVFNHIQNGKFFLPLYEIAGRRLCKQSDLDNFIANLKPIQTTPATKTKRRVGRPTKAAQIAAAAAKSGGAQ